MKSSIENLGVSIILFLFLFFFITSLYQGKIIGAVFLYLSIPVSMWVFNSFIKPLFPKKILEWLEPYNKEEDGSLFLLLFVLYFTCFLFGSRIVDGFTPAKYLVTKIQKESAYEFNGSICRDGTTSDSQGQGTCSWHGGVRTKFYKGQFKKTIEECKREALYRSWID